MEVNGTDWESSPTLTSTVASTGTPVTVTTNPNDGALAVDAVNPQIIYMATDWGIGTQNHTVSGGWVSGTEMGNNDGIAGVVLNDIAYYEYNATYKELWIAAKSGVGRAVRFDPTDLSSTSDLSDWYFPLYPDNSPAQEVAIHPSDPSIVLTGSSHVYKTTQGTSTSMSSITWTRAFSPTDHTDVFGSQANLSSITGLEFVPSTPTRAYLSAANAQESPDIGAVFYSDDTGSTWTQDASINATPVTCLYVKDNMVWAGVGDSDNNATGLRARTSVTGNGTWWTPATGTDLDGQYVQHMDGTRLGDINTVYVATQSALWKGVKDDAVTTCSGFDCWNWDDLTTPLASAAAMSGGVNVKTVAVNPSDADNAYAGIDNCVYETTNGGFTWAVYGTCSDANEEVKVLVYDDLLAGTADGLYGFRSTDAATDEAGSANATNATVTVNATGYASPVSNLTVSAATASQQAADALALAQSLGLGTTGFALVLDTDQAGDLLDALVDTSGFTTEQLTAYNTLVDQIIGGSDPTTVSDTIKSAYADVEDAFTAVTQVMPFQANGTEALYAPPMEDDAKQAVANASYGVDAFRMYKLYANGTATRLTYDEDLLTNLADGTWVFLDASNAGVAADAAYSAAYTPYVYVADNGPYDLNATAGGIADPVAFGVAADSTTASSSDDDNGGCVSGAGGPGAEWLLLALFPALMWLRRGRRG
jgi:hypothetical protein